MQDYISGIARLTLLQTLGPLSLLMKSNLDGEIIWHKEIDIQGASGELCTKVVVNNGEYYVLVNALFNGINAYFILKFDTNGNLIWSKKYGRQNNDRSTLYPHFYRPKPVGLIRKEGWKRLHIDAFTL
ncbi:MAG: hypothetical protein IPF52_05995 [Saprospiraceae bacterium]|nr:hypothetical protein [Saprospiraceae bacterium]